MRMTLEDLHEGIRNNLLFKQSYREGNWETYPECIAYNGTGSTNCVMASMIIYKKS